MKKKLLALALSLVMVVASLCGCGSSSDSGKYFDEVNTLVKEDSEVMETALTITLKGDITEQLPAKFVENGKFKASIKARTEVDKEGQFACVLALKLPGEDTFRDLTTIAVDSDYLYFTTDKLISFIKDMDLGATDDMDMQFKQMGIEKAGKISLEQINNLTDGKINFSADKLKENKEDIKTYLEEVIEILKSDFEDITGKDGSNYTLVVNKDDASKAIDDFVNFLDKDAKTVLNKTKDLFKKMKMDTNSEMFKNIDSNIKETKKDIEKNKKDIVKKIKEGNINIKSEANSKNGYLSILSENLKVNDSEVSFILESKKSSDKANVSKYIPKDAGDLTALIGAMQNMADSSSAAQ